MDETTEIRPQAGPQEQFLSTPADVAFYGGAAGGGKSFGLLLEPLRHIQRVRGYGGVIFRRVGTQITNEGGLWDTSMEIYPHVSAEPREYLNEWIFPPYGNRIKFAHMQYEKDRLSWQGSQIPFLAFDEGTHFLRKQIFYMFTRNRSTCGVRPYLRLTYNPVPPDAEPGGWIHEFVGWYIDEQGYPIPERSGVIRWFVNVRDTLHWYESKEAAVKAWPDIPPKSFTYIRSTVYDNQILLEEDPGYLANLMAADYVDQERLLRANHLIRPEAGKVFNKSDFVIVDAAPAEFDAIVRFWDFAATERKIAKGAATASVAMGLAGGRLYVLDVTEDWVGPGDVDGLVVNNARRDGRGVAIRWEEEGGASGKKDSFHLTQKLLGYDALGVRPTGDKLTRSKPLAAQVRAHNVYVVRDEWTERFLSHMHQIPDGARWDIHDAAAGAANQLSGVPAGIVVHDEPVNISPY